MKMAVLPAFVGATTTQFEERQASTWEVKGLPIEVVDPEPPEEGIIF